MSSPITSFEQQLIASVNPYIHNTLMYARPKSELHLWLSESSGKEWSIDPLGYSIDVFDELKSLILTQFPNEDVIGKNFYLSIEDGELRVDFRGMYNNSKMLIKLSDGFMDELKLVTTGQKIDHKPDRSMYYRVRDNQLSSLQPNKAEQLLLDNLEVLFQKKEFETPNHNWLWVKLPDSMRKDFDLHRKLVYIKVFGDLADAVSKSCIYSDVCNEKYYLEVSAFEEEGKLRKDALCLRAGYQSIIGSAIIMPLSEGFLDALFNKIQAKIEAKNTPVIDDIASASALPVARSSRAVGQKSTSNANENDIQRQLALLTIGDHKIHLPKQQLSQYAAIKALMLKAGGTYNSKGYFSFEKGQDISEIMDKLLNGDKVNVKKETQFFATSQSRTESACDALGEINGKRLLEPSAGDGVMADEAKRRGAEVVVIENWAPNVHKLEEKGYSVINQDFLTVRPEDIGLFDAILANPPFSKGQDIEHIIHMMRFLKPGGSLSTIASISAIEGTQKKQVEFQSFLKELNARIEMIPAGEFKESGTTVPTCHIAFIKPSLEHDMDNVDHDSQDASFSM